MNDGMLPPSCSMDNEPVQAYENMVNQIQAIMDDEEASSKIGGYEEALEKIGFTPTGKHLKGAEYYLDEDDAYLLVIATTADEWRLYELLERRNL